MKQASRKPAVPGGARKQTEPTDPLELVGEVVPGGDPDYLARCLAEEFAGMGRTAEEILTLFRDPGYAVPHSVYRTRGEAAVRELIREVLAECGVLRVTEPLEEPAPGCPDLVRIGCRSTPEEES